jgi:hypothetical protein
LDRVLHFYPGLASDHDPPTFDSQMAGIAYVYHHNQLV